MIEKRHKTAVRYNDISVLENHHVATSFSILSEHQYNILKPFKKDEYKKFRKIMIDAILATDMSHHFKQLGIFKGKVLSEDLDPKSPDEKYVLCQEMFHLADISNSTKQFDVCLKWCELLFVEFFHQGDTEKRLGHDVSQFMDRCTTNIAKSQVGFINFIIKPSFEAATIFLPGIHRNLENMEINKRNYESRIEDDEQRMNQEKAKWDQQ